MLTKLLIRIFNKNLTFMEVNFQESFFVGGVGGGGGRPPRNLHLFAEIRG